MAPNAMIATMGFLIPGPRYLKFVNYRRRVGWSAPAPPPTRAPTPAPRPRPMRAPPAAPAAAPMAVFLARRRPLRFPETCFGARVFEVTASATGTAVSASSPTDTRAVNTDLFITDLPHQYCKLIARGESLGRHGSSVTPGELHQNSEMAVTTELGELLRSAIQEKRLIELTYKREAPDRRTARLRNS